jgi:serine/threonine-protein kinase HipA
VGPKFFRWASPGLCTLLKREAARALFDFLVEACFESGISGVQPKVLIPEGDPLAGRATLT